MSLGTSIKSIQNIMRKDAGVDGDAQRISQLVWMLFLKIFDTKEEDYEFVDEDYQSPLPEELRWRNWAKNEEGITGDALLNFVNNELFPTLKELPIQNAQSQAAIIRGVFEDSYNYMKNGTLLRQVVNKMEEGIKFNTQAERHQFNDLYEQILKDLQSAGNAGEFYTPRAVTQFLVEMVDPKLGEKIIDPACGTGGFLVNAIEHIRKTNKIETKKERELLQNSIKGVEKKPLPHMLGTTNLLLHGIDVPSIAHDNMLQQSLQNWTKKTRVDVVIANPPFGGMEEDGIENNFPASYRTRETSNLFLYLFMHMLKDGGRAGIVLPDGFLFGEGVATRIKEKLLETCNVHTIIRLPNGVFAPYTNIKTNLIFFEKGTPTKDVWYYEHPYPKGYKNYSKSKPMRIEEFAPEKKWWIKRKESDRSWKVTIKEIKERNFNLDFKNPIEQEVEKLESSEVILSRISSSSDKIKSILKEIKQIIN